MHLLAIVSDGVLAQLSAKDRWECLFEWSAEQKTCRQVLDGQASDLADL